MPSHRKDHDFSKPITTILFPTFPNFTIAGSSHVTHFWPIGYEGKSAGWNSEETFAFLLQGLVWLLLFLPPFPLFFIEDVRSVAVAAAMCEMGCKHEGKVKRTDKKLALIWLSCWTNAWSHLTSHKYFLLCERIRLSFLSHWKSNFLLFAAKCTSI